MEAYLDNSATTRVLPEVAEAILEMLLENYGNPSSLHTKGYEAEQRVEQARGQIAQALSARREEIFFTSGGTEANNLAILGTAETKKRRGNRVVSTAYEHSSVEEALQVLEQQGLEVVRIRPQKDGNICPQEVVDAVNEQTILVSCMLVNNETGAVFPIGKISNQIKRKNPNVYIHTDAVQAFGKLDCSVDALGVDLLTVTAHKIHGPKGVGALYIRKGRRIAPRQFGGEQQQKVRPGTEASPLIVGFGLAAQKAEAERIESYHCVEQLQNYLQQRLTQEVADIELHTPAGALPYLLNLSLPGIRSEIMLHYLAQRQVYVSSGSACAKGQTSHVLLAMGIPALSADAALRVSLSKYTTQEELDWFVEMLKQGQAEIRRGRTR